MKFYSIIFYLVVTATVAQKQFVVFDNTLVEASNHDTLLTIKIPFSIENGMHIQDIVDIKENLIATVVSFEKNALFEVTNYEFTSIQYEVIMLDGMEHRVISNDFIVEVTLKPMQNHQNKIALEGNLFYQACNKRQCFFPRSLDFTIAL